MNQDTKSLIPAPRAAHIFGITPQTLHKWRKKGHLLTVQLPNGRYAVPESEVTRILQPTTVEVMESDYVGGGR